MVLREIMAEESKEKYSSIFDAASKIQRKKAMEKAFGEADSLKEGAKLPEMTDKEVAERLEKYEKLHNLLADSLEQAFVKSNLTPKRLREYFNTSQNFSQEQWRLIEDERQKIEAMLEKLIPHPRAKEEQEKTKQKRPQKMQVKSRWMPMR